jgi:hypothetical protein
MMYELWDSDSRNVIRFFESAVEANDVLTASVRKSGLAILDSLALIHEDDQEENHLVAEGEAILVAIKRLSAAEISEMSGDPPTRRHVN